MAKAFFNNLISAKLNWYAESAGTEPSEKLNPIVVEDNTTSKPNLDIQSSYSFNSK